MNLKGKNVWLASALAVISLTIGCGEESGNDDDGGVEPGRIDISVIADKYYHSDAVTVIINETTIEIRSTSEPDHKSMYYQRNHELYEAYSEPNNPDFFQNPNRLSAQNLTFTIPRYPEEANRKEATGFGPIGVAVNSVVFYNQNAAPGDDILEELNTFDQFEGHPQQQGQYHYHIEPVWLTSTIDEEAFLGLLMDGFPVYGPVEDGKRMTNDDLDAYHGHTSPTADFPDGIYHYHVTDDLPWINGDGYFGTPGTFTN